MGKRLLPNGAKLMILSDLKLTGNQMNQLGVSHEYEIHKFVYSLFPGPVDKKRDFLYVKKYDKFRRVVIRILSQRNPTAPDYGILQCRRIPMRYLEHQEYNFTVKVNPARRKHKTLEKYPIIDHDELVEWFINKSLLNGMMVDQYSLEIRDRGITRIYKPDSTIVLNKATFVGRFRVTNQELFKDAFIKGFGQAKAYGFGLLEIKPAELM